LEPSSPKTMWEKIEKKNTICHEKLLLKPCGKIRRK
jgi:hypothetical protein